MSIKNNKVATTIKLDGSLYDQFKIFGIRHKITLQALVEKSIYRYVTEEPFRNDINCYILPISTAITSSVS